MSARHAVIAIRQLEKNTGASRVAFSQAALLRQAEQAAAAGVEVDIRRFAVAA